MRDQLQESQLSRKKSLGVVVGFHREESAQPVGFWFLTGGKRWIFLHGMCTILVFLRRRLSPQLSLLLCACDRMPPAFGGKFGSSWTRGGGDWIPHFTGAASALPGTLRVKKVDFSQ